MALCPANPSRLGLRNPSNLSPAQVVHQPLPGALFPAPAEKLSRQEAGGNPRAHLIFPQVHFILFCLSGITILLSLRSTVLKMVVSYLSSGFGYFKQDGNSDACFHRGWKQVSGFLEDEGWVAEASALSAAGCRLLAVLWPLCESWGSRCWGPVVCNTYWNIGLALLAPTGTTCLEGAGYRAQHRSSCLGVSVCLGLVAGRKPLVGPGPGVLKSQHNKNRPSGLCWV